MTKQKDIEIIFSKDNIVVKSAIKHIDNVMEKRRNNMMVGELISKITDVVCGDCGEYLFKDIVKSGKLGKLVLYCKNCVKKCQHNHFKLIREMNIFCEIVSEYKCLDCGKVFRK